MTILDEMEMLISCHDPNAVESGEECNICQSAQRCLDAVRELVEAADGIELCTDADHYNRLRAALAPFVTTIDPHP
jgi:hypothetical protein